MLMTKGYIFINFQKEKTGKRKDLDMQFWLWWNYKFKSYNEFIWNAINYLAIWEEREPKLTTSLEVVVSTDGVSVVEM